MAHILLVDDQLFLLDFLMHELTQMGHEVSCVNDRDALYVFLEEHAPDLVLLDPNLNGFQGWELLREIKSPGRRPIPTILFTSFKTTLQDPRTALAEGYVIKNVDTQDLKEKMGAILSAVKNPFTHQPRWPLRTQQNPPDAPERSMFAGKE
jgi:DNA-binding response OmpR family regulator